MKESAPQAREKKRDWYLLSKLSSTQVGVGRWSKVQSENKRYLAFLQKLNGLDPYSSVYLVRFTQDFGLPIFQFARVN